MQLDASLQSEKEVTGDEARFSEGHKAYGPNELSLSDKHSYGVLTLGLSKLLESSSAKEQIRGVHY